MSPFSSHLPRRPLTKPPRIRDGHYGLYLDASLLDGSSASCPTFGNPPLCGRERVGGKGKREVSFECVGLEVWGVGPG